MLGLLSKRALVIGLMYVIGFEGVLSRNLAGIKSVSVREFAISISQAVSSGTITVPGSIPIRSAEVMGTIMLVAAVAWTMRKLVRYELAERL